MKKILISLFVILLSIVAVLIYTYNQELIESNSEIAYGNIKRVIDKTIIDEKIEILSIALALSKNKQLKESLLNSNKQAAHLELKEIIDYIKRYSNKEDIHAQIISKNSQVFARSWQKDIIQNSLLKNKTLVKTPKVEVVFEDSLNIKALVPIYEKGKFLGVLEVITLLDTITKNLRTYDIEVLIFANKSLLDLNNIKNKNLIVNKELILSNKNYNKQIFYKLNSLQHKHIKKLFENSFFLDEKNFYGVYNVNNMLGKFIVISSKENLAKFHGNNYSILQNIFNLNSSQEDLFKYIKQRSFDEENSFSNETIDYRNIDKEKLEKLSKDELIELILNSSKPKIIDGKIK